MLKALATAALLLLQIATIGYGRQFDQRLTATEMAVANHQALEARLSHVEHKLDAMEHSLNRLQTLLDAAHHNKATDYGW